MSNPPQDRAALSGSRESTVPTPEPSEAEVYALAMRSGIASVWDGATRYQGEAFRCFQATDVALRRFAVAYAEKFLPRPVDGVAPALPSAEWVERVARETLRDWRYASQTTDSYDEEVEATVARVKAKFAALGAASAVGAPPDDKPSTQGGPYHDRRVSDC